MKWKLIQIQLNRINFIHYFYNPPLLNATYQPCLIINIPQYLLLKFSKLYSHSILYIAIFTKYKFYFFYDKLLY